MVRSSTFPPTTLSWCRSCHPPEPYARRTDLDHWQQKRCWRTRRTDHHHDPQHIHSSNSANRYRGLCSVGRQANRFSGCGGNSCRQRRRTPVLPGADTNSRKPVHRAGARSPDTELQQDADQAPDQEGGGPDEMDNPAERRGTEPPISGRHQPANRPLRDHRIGPKHPGPASGLRPMGVVTWTFFPDRIPNEYATTYGWMAITHTTHLHPM